MDQLSLSGNTKATAKFLGNSTLAIALWIY